MVVDKVVKNGLIVTPEGTFDGGVAINEGKIVSVAKSHLLPPADETIDAKGKWVLPGAIDTHTHVYIPPWCKEDFKTGTKAAACGGVTTILEMPSFGDLNSNFVSKIEEKKVIAGNDCLVDFGLWAGEIMEAEHLNDIEKLVKAGCVAFKITMGGDTAASNDEIFYDALVRIGKTGSLVAVHAENNYLLNYFAKQVKKMQDAGKKVTYNMSRPPICEVEAISRAIMFSDVAGNRLHIAHMSTKTGVEFVKAARMMGQPVTAEATVHHLLFSTDDYKKRGHYIITNPPKRSKEDVAALWEGLRHGWVDNVVTDHCPFPKAEKDEALKDILKAPAGIHGLETLVTLIFSEGVNKGRLTPEQLVAVMSEKPARLFGIYPRKGALIVGADADLNIIDPKKKHTITADYLRGIADYTPYEGWKVQGWLDLTMIRGVTVAKDMQAQVKPGFGKFIHATPSQYGQ